MSDIQQIDQKLGLLTLTFAIFVCILIFTSLDLNGNVSCKLFIPNIYMYVILAILLVGIFTLLREKYITPSDERAKLYNYSDPEIYRYTISGLNIGLVAILLLIIYGFGGGYTLQNHVLNHIVWFVILIGISTIFYPLFKLRISHEYMNRAAIYVISLFLVMSAVVYAFSMKGYNPASYNWMGAGLLGGLVAIIVGSLLLFFLASFGWIPFIQYISIFQIILYVSIILFALYISYDTAYILQRVKTCNTKSRIYYPNYPMESFMIFIDLYNIFADLLHLEAIRQFF